MLFLQLHYGDVILDSVKSLLLQAAYTHRKTETHLPFPLQPLLSPSTSLRPLPVGQSYMHSMIMLYLRFTDFENSRKSDQQTKPRNKYRRKRLQHAHDFILRLRMRTMGSYI